MDNRIYIQKKSCHSITYYNNEPISGREDKNSLLFFMPKKEGCRESKTGQLYKTGKHKYSKSTHHGRRRKQ
jgi:hypothetical protein